MVARRFASRLLGVFLGDDRRFASHLLGVFYRQSLGGLLGGLENHIKTV